MKTVSPSGSRTPGLGSCFVGIDENGLGPRLGPLVVTSVLARVSPEGEAVLSGDGGLWRGRLGDSKRLVAFGHDVLGEAWARGVAQKWGEAPQSPDALLRALFLDNERFLKERCPVGHEAQCWSSDEERFEADTSLVLRVDEDLRELAALGVDVLRARVVIACVERLNRARENGRSRLDVDLEAMERLVLAARSDAGREVVAVCGKVGGMDRYRDRFGPLAPFQTRVKEEGRARSTYGIEGVGEVSFVRDADATDRLVGMASLIGKWVRDALMDRIVRYHQRHTPSASRVSGYNDPKTAQFVAETALVRKSLRMPDRCFEREKSSKNRAHAEDSAG